MILAAFDRGHGAYCAPGANYARASTGAQLRAGAIMRRLVATGFALVLGFALIQGCATKEQTGAVLGGVAGGVLGSQVGGGHGRTLAIIAGTLAGTMIGSTIGRYMDEQDRMRMAQTFETNRTNQTSAWKNPDTGSSYAVTPTRTTFPAGAEGQPCREFRMKADVGGKPQDMYGTACRQSDGSWKVVQ